MIGAASGAAGGFIGGAGNAWASGANFGSGLRSGLIGGGFGALGGAITGGIAAGIRFREQHIMFMRGNEQLGINGGDPVPATDQFLRDAQKAWYPDAPMDQINNFSVENVPATTQTNMNLEQARAATVATSNKSTGLITGRSSVYFNTNPNFSAFSDAKQLFYAMGHEFVHVSQYAALANQPVTLLTKSFRYMMDFGAYSYQHSLGSTNYGGYTSADVRQFMTSFPDWYSKLGYINFNWTYNHSFSYPF